MRTVRAKAETKMLNDIVETLKRVPKARLEAVRAVVQALAVPESPIRGRESPSAQESQSRR